MTLFKNLNINLEKLVFIMKKKRQTKEDPFPTHDKTFLMIFKNIYLYPTYLPADCEMKKM